MARFNDTLLNSQQAFARGVSAPMANPRRGGQFGWAPNYGEWLNNQQYVRQQVYCVVLEVPTAFQFLPNPEVWIGTLRSLMELHAVRITGLENTLSVDTVDTPFGGSGQMHEDPSNVTVSQTNLTVEFNEKYGMPVSTFMNGWIRHCIKDPYSKFATINTLSSARVTDMMADRYSMSCAFFEPDPSHTTILKSWIGTNMWPKSGGEIIAARDLTAGGENVNYSIPFSGIYQSSLGTNRFCQALLESMDITGASPYGMASFIDKVHSDVLAQNTGLHSNLEATKRGATSL